jgi:hypothetical protein
MTGYNLDIPGEREDRRKHLDLIAAVVGRMATASAQAKGWSITLAGAAFGVAVIRDNWVLIVLGIIGLMAFAKIDAHYLDVEKDFRDLHDAVVDNTVTPFAMDPRGVSTRTKNESYKSWSIKWFYGPLIAAGCLLLIYSLCYGRSESEPTKEQTVKVTVTVTPTEIPAPVSTSPLPTPSAAPTSTGAPDAPVTVTTSPTQGPPK